MDAKKIYCIDPLDEWESTLMDFDHKYTSYSIHFRRIKDVDFDRDREGIDGEVVIYVNGYSPSLEALRPTDKIYLQNDKSFIEDSIREAFDVANLKSEEEDEEEEDEE